MVGQNERRNVDRRKDTSIGHDVMWELSVGDLVHLKSRPFKKIFKTFCEESPSAWRFEMSLPEVRDDGSCSLSVLLERIDSLELYLEACFWVDIGDSNGNLIFERQTFTKTKALPGDVLQETVEMTSFEDRKEAMHQNPKIYFTLMICFCHAYGESD